MKISTKIFCWQLSLMVFIIANGVYAVVSSGAISSDIDTIREEVMENERILANTKSLIASIQNHSKSYLLSQAVDEQQKTETLYGELDKTGRLFSQKNRGRAALMASYRKLVSQTARYRQAMENLDTILQAAPDPTIRRALIAQGLGPIQEIERDTELLLKSINAEITGSSATYFAGINTSTGNQTKVAYAIMLLSLLFSLSLAVVAAKTTTRPITKAINVLDDIARQVAAASHEISAGSQNLAQGASEQAATLQETAAAHEEISAMIRQNAGNAQQADLLMREVERVVGLANGSMLNLISSMEEITKASEETSKVVKSIDAIAFQTNLLALNAAVEAARAGDAGAGFAVVANEVRNLAMLAAEAAKNTTSLIDSTTDKVTEGARLAATTKADFSVVAASSTNAQKLVGEIALASDEQARGMEQLRTGMDELNAVVQHLAANAEQYAGSSHEMKSLAGEMTNLVEELAAVVGNDSASATAIRRHPTAA